METAAIVTTVANRELAALHERMPVVVPPEAFDLWLDCGKVDAMTATALIAPAREGVLEAYEVSPAVNRHDNDGPQLIEPASAQPPASEPVKPARKPKKDERQSSLF
jgi:putative SOS response-associated peptidase YedK